MHLDRNEVAAAWRALEAFGIRKNGLLAKPEANPKLAKGIALGVLSAPLHLAPASLSGFNVCPMATAGCKAACLHTAGNPAAMAGKSKARIAKTRAYFKARDSFMVALANDINKLQAKAERLGMICGVRLNATSDIPWERIPVVVNDGRKWESLMRLFPQVSFYDYTKRHNRTNLPSNYRLTFSLADSNDAHAIAALHNGINVSAVLNIRRGKSLPGYIAICDGKLWTNERDWTALDPSRVRYVRVIDGDEHDFRPFDPPGVIVGLRAKGKAIGDTSGFVRSSASI